ncbi:MAG: N-6 DNA methylase [Nanoarchaeota archaeon]
MANERNTENIVRDHFKKDPLYNIIKLEEQKSSNKKIDEILQYSSKSGSGVGKPEFLITFPSGDADYIIVIECKADITLHKSKKEDNPKDYAVDGVIKYAKKLAEKFNVIAIAVSGETEKEMLVSHFLFKKQTKTYSELKEGNILCSINDYLRIFGNNNFADNLKNIDIIQKAIYLNELYQSYSVTENTRCTMISAILVSLLDDPFRSSYNKYNSSASLAKAILSAIQNVLEKNNVKGKGEMLGEYNKILNEPLFKEEKIKHRDEKDYQLSIEINKGIIDYIHENVYPLVDMEQSGFDVLGRFYTEFIRYAGSEQSQGLVLTPSHITDLFCDLANINENSILYDPCCGTGGFLIAGMKRMLKLAGDRETKIKSIKSKQLIGVELRPSMFTYACSNMMMRGDGKSNIYCGDCFSLENSVMKNHKPNIAFLNPPYDVGNAGQMRFIEHALKVVEPQNGIVVAIVQMSCAFKNEKELIAIKKRILEKNRLIASLSMPDDLFYPIGVITTIMVFKAGEKNEKKKTWFGYFKDDGFEKRKHRGRIDARSKWLEIKDKWIRAYNNLDEVPGISIKAEVTEEEEWCAEAYMKTDYSVLSEKNFENKMRDYVAFTIESNTSANTNSKIGEKIKKKNISLSERKWKWFKYDSIFEIKHGFYNRKPDTNPNGEIIFIGATELNNGITSHHKIEDIEATPKAENAPNVPLKEKIFEKNSITVSNNGSVGYAFYQPINFTCSHDVNPLYLKEKELNKYIAMFLCPLIELEQYRWAFGRKWRPIRMPLSEIKLPINEKGNPDWNFMENYIKSLPYSSNL